MIEDVNTELIDGLCGRGSSGYGWCILFNSADQVPEDHSKSDERDKTSSLPMIEMIPY